MNNNNGVRLEDCRELLEINQQRQVFQKSISKRRFPKLKDFTVKMHSMFGSTYVRRCRSRQIFGGVKEFCPIVPKRARKKLQRK